jgi:CheY-like chemotaxis protein
MATNLKVIERLLSTYDIEVMTCESGEQALDIVNTKDFDLIFMDHMMPGMDGVEATKAIRNINEDLSKLPIIALSANAVYGAREMFLENGFSDFISKPVEIDKLNDILKKWIPIEKLKNSSTDEDQKSSQEDENIYIPPITGVDIESGLYRIGGSKIRYLELLDIFYRETTNTLRLLVNVPNEDSLRSFTTKVHALKSALANIGANKLTETAALLEKASTNSDINTIDINLNTFRKELIKLTEEIKVIVSKTTLQSRTSQTADTETHNLNNKDIKEELSLLLKAIEVKDIDTIDLTLIKLRSFPLSGKTYNAISELSDLVLEAEFELAASKITSLFNEVQP